MPVIEAHELSKSFGGTSAVDRVSMSVERGEVFGFLGPNGAGKTTTVRLLLGLLRPSGGSATVFGLDADAESVGIRGRLGNLPGDYSYDPRMTGREIVSFFSELRGRRDIGRADALAERFEADLDRRVGDLSRGNRQKIGLIQAAFHEPELLLLDEPTASLDPLMQEEFLGFVAEEREHGVTVFFSSHELDEIERSCDRAGVIRAGSLVAVEDVAEVTRRSFKHVRIELAAPTDPEPFRRIAGVSELAQSGPELRFKATGELDAVIKAASALHVIDLEVTRPTLEEVVLTYYGRGPGR